MRKIKIKNFGPIREGYLDGDGLMEIKKVTLFIGNQGSGKSTIAKLISTLTWLEKAVHRGEIDPAKFTFRSFLDLLKGQRINNYWQKEKTQFEYEGEAYRIYYSGENVRFLKQPSIDNYQMPKIMYVPAERSFLSTVKDAFDIKGLPETLFWFAEEFKKSQSNLRGKAISLPVGKVIYKYNEEEDQSYIETNRKQVNLLEASSGFHSLIPLFLVTRNLILQIIDDSRMARLDNVNNNIRMNAETNRLFWESNDDMPVGEVKRKISIAIKKYVNECLINIVEEPELNLYPSSQREILNSLLEFNNAKDGNNLIMTTHSPYLINYLTLAVKAGSIYEILKEKKDKITDIEYANVSEVVPKLSFVGSKDLVIYELDEIAGSIKKLDDYKGLPSDENYLNESLAEANELFARLLEIQQTL